MHPALPLDFHVLISLQKCDIVGTGGDSHSTFNVSTTASIIASPFLLTAKHGNRAQTSMSGSADVLNAIAPTPPKLTALTAEKLPQIYEKTNYAFLFAPNFHPGMRYAAPVRRDLGIRTIFNLLGPLANPVDWAIEARIVGVAYQELGPVFAEALQLSGAKKSLVVCGAEDLDEISCAGPTNCWMLREVVNPHFRGPVANEDGDRDGDGDRDETTSDEEAAPRMICQLDKFQLCPADFGLTAHPLSEVFTGKMPKENAAKLMSILRNELRPDDPILDFVLLNTAALLVVSGVCEADDCLMGGEVITERGAGGQRWKEGVRRARWCIESGQALAQLEKFITATNEM
jgi:anthranilate phosphoribosyltransferase